MLCLGKLSNGCSWSCPQLKGWHMLTCLSCLAMDSTNGISGPKPSPHSVVCVYFSLSPFFDFLCPLGLCLLYIIAAWGQSSWQEAHRLIGTPGVSWWAEWAALSCLLFLTFLVVEKPEKFWHPALTSLQLLQLLRILRQVGGSLLATLSPQMAVQRSSSKLSGNPLALTWIYLLELILNFIPRCVAKLCKAFIIVVGFMLELRWVGCWVLLLCRSFSSKLRLREGALSGNSVGCATERAAAGQMYGQRRARSIEATALARRNKTGKATCLELPSSSSSGPSAEMCERC